LAGFDPDLLRSDIISKNFCECINILVLDPDVAAGVDMSSILNALKKAEKERGAPPRSTTPITREILKVDVSRRRTFRYRLPLFFFGLLALGVGTGVFFVRTDEVSPVPTAQDVSGKSTALVASVPPPPIVVPAVSDVASKVEKKVVKQVKPVPPKRKRVSTSAPKKKSVKVVKKSKVRVTPPVTHSKPKPTSRKRSVSTFAATRRSTSSSTSHALVSPIVVPSRKDGWLVQDVITLKASDLRVSEIHWRQVAKERLAVVNDLSVLEGADIQGVRVDRIFKNRVRFVINGRYLEVKLSSKRVH
jgi:hypothetical protein